MEKTWSNQRHFYADPADIAGFYNVYTAKEVRIGTIRADKANFIISGQFTGEELRDLVSLGEKLYLRHAVVSS